VDDVSCRAMWYGSKGSRRMTEYLVEVVDSFLHPQPRAECSCGWKGPYRETMQQAHSDAIAHNRSWRDD